MVPESTCLKTECNNRIDGLSYIGRATDFSQLLEAYALVYREYRKLGYIAEHPSRLHYTPFQLSASNQTLVALDEEGNLVGTGSIVVECEHGIPSSYLFGEELSRLIRGKRKIAEGTLLSCRDTDKLDASEISVQIIRTAISYLVSRDVSHACVVANPKHARFWEETLGFELLGECRPCRQAQGAPGFLFVIDLDALVRQELKPTHLMKEAIVDRWINPETFLYDYSLEADEIVELMQLRPELRSV